MPNYVKNILKINAEGEDLKNIRNFLRSGIRPKDRKESNIISFNSIIPMPKDLNVMDVSNPNEKTKERYESNLKKYRYKTWYDWRNAYWGTKWDACDPEEIDEKTIVFQTAWGSVYGLIKLLSCRYPNIRFDYSYADENWGYNCGSGYFCEGIGIMDRYEDGSKEASIFALDVWGVTDCHWSDEKQRIVCDEDEEDD